MERKRVLEDTGPVQRADSFPGQSPPPHFPPELGEPAAGQGRKGRRPLSSSLEETLPGLRPSSFLAPSPDYFSLLSLCPGLNTKPYRCRGVWSQRAFLCGSCLRFFWCSE